MTAGSRVILEGATREGLSGRRASDLDAVGSDAALFTLASGAGAAAAGQLQRNAEMPSQAQSFSIMARIASGSAPLKVNAVQLFLGENALFIAFHQS